MTLYGDAVSIVRSVILIEERVRTNSTKGDALATAPRQLANRVTRLEAIIESVRPDDSVLKIAPPTSDPIA